MKVHLVLGAVALTALLLTTTQPAGETSPAAAPATTSSSVPPSTSAAPPPPPARVYASSSELPDGPDFPASGTGTFHVVPGSGPVVGTGPLRTYAVEVEDGITVDEQAFASFVDATLGDPRGWTARGARSVQRVAGPASLRIRLTSQNTARSVCGFEIPVDVSCRDGNFVFLSAARWFRGAVAYLPDLTSYRQYMVNHETGHAFGQGHRACEAAGAPAPVMMQQTFSVSNDEIVHITNGVPQGAVIPQDGKVCKPNPWPYP
ncbi:DUF3152 domain-containing protein [Lentzea flava]|uniref:DUF3152 domain-containing protein n=1 Tax=Lentzea flava TaxID=103732 RepID=A0ABQ2UKJ7_9PSEU|nr:DUF3152 domain-containing protein [Lentzea flava]MCP2200466.1 Protein of unknown function (DUF3152) [Lentzea flava]GGU42386.1 hypothetical protein GCM10010178_38680 [Lentzea flava]